jgi:phosphatidylserine/phosphatidylglycerophosphate/cardiolipin synthase-like enzyme
MKERPFLKARFLCSKWEQDDGQDSVDAIRKAWPEDLRKPEVYRQTTDFSGSIMHIKTVITDDTRMIIGSANFTKAGLNKNLELGILLEGPFVARVSGTLADLAKSPFFEKVGLS